MGKDANSLGALYSDSVQQRRTPAMPTISGSSIGSAYDQWFEADQESQWLAALERRRKRANSDETQVISLDDVDAYARQREAEKSWDREADEALAVSGRSGSTARGHDPTERIPVSRETSTQEPSKGAATGHAARAGEPSRSTGETSPTEVGASTQPGTAAAPEAAPETARQGETNAGNGGLLRSSALMAAGTLVSRVLGLVRSALLVAALGASTGIANTWDYANTLPNIIYLLLAGGVINAVLVPQITRALEHSDGGKAYTDRIVTLTLIILAGVTAIFMAAAPLAYRIFDNNDMTPEKSHVAWMFSLICLPQIFFYGVYTIFGQVLNARGRFGAFMWSPALANVVIIGGLLAFIVLYPHGQKHIPGYGDWTPDMILMLALPATLGIVAQALVLLPVLKRAGYRYTPNFSFRGVGLRSASTMAGWAFGAVIVQQIGFVVTSQLLGSQPDGAPGRAAQSQAFLLFTLPHSLITLSLVTALFTRMSVAAGRGETAKVKSDMDTGIRLSGLASVLLTFGCFALIFPMVSAMFGPVNRWSIGSFAIAMLVGLVPYSLCLVIQRVFYAYNDAKTPFWMQIICTTVAIALTLPWFFLTDVTILGHPGTHWVGIGVGLAQTLSNAVQAAVGFVLLRRKIGRLSLGDSVRTYVRLAVAALLATAVAYPIVKVLESLLGISRFAGIVQLAVAGVLFLGVYIVVAKKLRVREIDDLLSPVTRRLRRA